MKYNKGIKGPETNTIFTILAVNIRESEKIATGAAIAHLKNGPRGVKFVVQGKNLEAMRSMLESQDKFHAMARWTGREAVTFTGLPAQAMAA